MSKKQKRHLFCVWDNKDDSIVAIDLDADKCSANMGITRETFYSILCRIRSNPAAERKWTIIRSDEIESEGIA
ncbi:MAG: hypothetical protein IIZ93_14575 [Acidaminococcaceae bacterium]|nr:hypothetical protein [Acidaminococcaceae bacterium]